jgi:glycosyltransferase involved in cell wall biosynthesis
MYSLAKELGLEDRVLFWELYDVPQLLKNGWYCGLVFNYDSLAAVEGMASGKPVIASNVEALTTTVKERVFYLKQRWGNNLQSR